MTDEQRQEPLLENLDINPYLPTQEDPSFQYVQERFDAPMIDINIPNINTSKATIKIKDSSNSQYPQLMVKSLKALVIALKDLKSHMISDCVIGFIILTLLIHTILLIIILIFSAKK